MIRLRGIPAAPGVAVAPVRRVGVASAPGPTRLDLGTAVDVTARQLAELAASVAAAGRAEESGIIEAQAMLARDEELLSVARGRIAEGVAVDDAILMAGDEAAASLEALDDELLAARAADVRDVVTRIVRAVRGEVISPLTERSVVVATDLAPSVAAELDPGLLGGIALEGGSRTSHAVILARAFAIPAVVAVPGLLDAAADGSEVAIDGGRGEVVIDPDQAFHEELRGRFTERAAQLAADRAVAAHPLETRDGRRVHLLANLGRPDEVARAIAEGAEGVGLLRTEFLFANRRSLPDVETQSAAYAEVIGAFPDGPVVVRLLDVGGDKPLPYLPGPPEANPFLGVRAIRLADRHPALLRGQLRAILHGALRAGQSRPLIMAPMVADLADLRGVRAVLDAEAADIGDEIQPRLGIMVEVPAAVLVADQLAAEAAFLSIGTNDLTQYLLAADRTNPELAARQDPLHPAVLRAVRMVVDGASRHGVPVAVCGEMAGDPFGAILLVGLGVSELSMDPASFAGVKRALAAVSVAQAEDLARRAIDESDADGVRRLQGADRPV